MVKIRNILSAVFLVLGFVSCAGNGNTNETAVDKAERLEREVAQKDSLLNDVFISLNQIAENLTLIKDREGIVTTYISPEISKEQKVQIGEDIAAINLLLEQNRLSLQRLNGTTEQLRRANVELGELETLVANFAKQIQDKDQDIVLLRSELSDMHIRIDEMNAEMESLYSDVTGLSGEKQSLETTLASQDKALNTVYYITGSERSLRDEGIVEKSGFIGRTLKVGSHYELDKFTPVDRRSLEHIIVGQRRSTLVTPHPEGSYRLITDNDGRLVEILITDPEHFWETSRILIVSYK